MPDRSRPGGRPRLLAFLAAVPLLVRGLACAVLVLRTAWAELTTAPPDSTAGTGLIAGFPWAVDVLGLAVLAAVHAVARRRAARRAGLAGTLQHPAQPVWTEDLL